MSEGSCKIKLSPSKKLSKDEDIVSVPQNLLHVSKDQLLNLKIGQREYDIHCVTHTPPKKGPYELLISKKLFRKLDFPKGLLCNFMIDGHRLHIGPVIGILVSKKYTQNLLINKFNFRSVETVKANEIAGTILYYFSTKDIDFEHQQIKGTYYNQEKDKWEAKIFPFPNVLYDRGSGRNKKSSKIRKILMKANIKKLNAIHYFDKWELYQHLKTHKNMTSSLPLTRLYRSPHDVKEMFKYCQTLYMKSCVSSMGKKVMRITKHGPGDYSYSYYDNQLIEGEITDKIGFLNTVYACFEEDKVVVQKAIDLIRVNGCIVDMRGTVQRNGKGHLEINSIAVRVAGNHSPITSTRSGSTVYQFEEFFDIYPEHLKLDIESLRNKIKKSLIMFYECIEKSYGKFGEMGIDFGIDYEGNVQFIESNAKPAKTSLYHSYDDETIQKSFLNPLEYAKHIAGF